MSLPASLPIRLSCLGLLLAWSTLPAAEIPGLYNTGIDDSGALLPAGSVDPHWILLESDDPAFPGPEAFVVNEGWPIAPAPDAPWIENGPDSKWIAPQAEQGTGNAVGDYTYRLRFSLEGLEPSSAEITLRLSSDNATGEVLLNGINTGVSYSGDFTAWSQFFTIDSGFAEGTNTLDFVVSNPGGSANPTALRVELSGSADLEAPPGTPPTVTEQPGDVTVGIGDSALFSIGVFGSKPLSYQWRLDGQPLAGGTNRTLVVAGVTAADQGEYDVVVSNDFGSDTSQTASLEVVLLSPAELTYEPLGPSTRRTGLVLSELMYHPAERGDGRNLEFVEIYNSNPFFEDLSGYRLSGEVDYAFPPGTRLEGLSYLVVAADPAAVESVYGLTGVLGGWTNRLDNGGGTLRLRKASDAVILELDYNDNPPWPVAADGKGHSLILARPSYGHNHPRAWEASARIGGSPGEPDPIPTGLLENILINEILAHTDLPSLDYVELYNHSPLPVDLSGCWLSDDRDTNRFRIPDGTVLPALGYLVFEETELGFGLAADGETLYLVTPDQQRVLDVLRFDGQANGVAFGRFPDGAPGFQELTAQTPGTPNAPHLVRDIVINEIMYHPISGDSDEEYIELYNQGNAPVDVGGWRFVDGIDYAIPPGTSIAAGGYLVVAKSAARLLTNHPTLGPDTVVGDYGGRLSDGGERVAIAMPDLLFETNAVGTVTSNLFFITVDEVTYVDGGRWTEWSDGGGSSLELIDPHSDNRLAANWADSDETGKAPWTLVEHTGVLDLGTGDATDQLQLHLQGKGEALIDEVVVAAVGGANRLPNPTFEASTGGWVPQGTHRRSTHEPFEGFNSARSLLVRASDRGDQNVNRVRADFSPAFSPGQSATLRAQVRWRRGHPEILFRLKENYLEAVGRMTVPANLGTPGAANSAALSNAAPAIHAVRHDPPLPAARQPIRVTARVHDPDGVSNIALQYRLDPASTLANVFMVDDGTQGDRVAGDGEFTGLIPGQAPGTLVAFRVLARDAHFPPATGTFPEDAPATECLVRVGEFVPEGAFGTYRFWITEATFDFWSSREQMSNESLDCTFVYGNHRVVYNATAHFAGSPFTSPGYTTPTGVLCGYDILYPDDDPFLGDDHVILDWPVRDPTNQREQLMFWMLEQYGLPNLYRRYVHLFVNGVRRGTIYDDVQQPGRDVTEQWYGEGDEGHLYKTDFWFEFGDNGGRENGTPNSLQNFTTTGGVKKTARYRWNWKPRVVQETANNFDPLFDLVDAVNSEGEAYIPTVESLVDVEHWMRTFAMHDLASYWDGFGNPNHKNTYLYKPPDLRWQQFSWDFDVGLGVFNDEVNEPLFPGGIDPTVQRMYNTPAFVRAYWRALQEGLDTFFDAASVTPLLQAKYQAFQDNNVNLASPFEPTGPFNLSIPDWITQRREFLLDQLQSVAAPFAVDGPDTLTNATSLLNLSGTAPVTATTVVVNGVPYPVTWTTETQWLLQVPLQPGTQTLLVQAVDRSGTPLPGASRTLNVSFPGSPQSPVDVVVINEIMYHPEDSRASFVELHNTSGTLSFDLSGWRLNGVDYTFPPGSILTNGQYLVLVEDSVAFGRAFGNDIPIHGVFDGRLDNGGETLTLFMPGTQPGTEVVVDRVTYDDQPPWPTSADGLGPSLQLIDARQDNNRVSNWSDGQGWRFFSFTSSSASFGGSRLSFFFDVTGGDIFLDDISFVEGGSPDAGPNILSNGSFEEGLDDWGFGTLATNSVLVTDDARAGSNSLHLVVEPGPLSLTTFFQVFDAVTPSVDHTLSFWYKPGSQGTNFNARLNSLYFPKLTIEKVLATPVAANDGTALLPPYPPLWLSEVQPLPQGTVLDNAGEADPWIEIHNSGPDPINLESLFLSHDLQDLTRWSFPTGAVIQPGQYRLVWADGQPEQTDALNWHTSFRLNPTNGTVALSRLFNNAPLILDYLSYQNLEAGHSYGSHPPAQTSFRQSFFFPTPGAVNNPAVPPAQIFVNEWMASNNGSVRDPADQDADDWFELFNPNNEPVDLAGYWLTDNPSNPAKFVIPQGYVIPAQGFLLVWADEEQSQANLTGQLHVNFRLSAGGESITLRAPDGFLIDSVFFGPQMTDLSQGRFPDGAPSPFPTLTSPTPGAPNIFIDTPPDIVVLDVQFSDAGLMLVWSAENGRTYQVQYKETLSDPSWTDLPGGSVTATGDTATVTDPAALTRPQRFYRILLP